jgi:hypothetical protein
MSYSVFPIDFLTRSYEWESPPEEFIITDGIVHAALGNGMTRTRVEFQDAFRGWRCSIKNLSITDDTGGCDYVLFEDFYWNTVKGGAEPFEWHNPLTGETQIVRFSSNDAPSWEMSEDNNQQAHLKFVVLECAGLTESGYTGAVA